MASPAQAIQVRSLIADAVRAGRYATALRPDIARDIEDGVDVPFDRLGLDSLGWMEFCISIEVNAGLELTPTLIETMRSLGDVERWMLARLPG